MKTRGFSQVFGLPSFVVSFFFPLRCFPARVRSGIANGGSAPIWMAPFPPVKAVETDGVANQPNLTGAKVTCTGRPPRRRIRHHPRRKSPACRQLPPPGAGAHRPLRARKIPCSRLPARTTTRTNIRFCHFSFSYFFYFLGTERATCSGVKMTERRCGRYGVFPLCLHQGMAGSPGFILAAVPGGRGETVGNRTLRGRSPGSSLSIRRRRHKTSAENGGCFVR